MVHHDHVQLIRAGITRTGGTWADFGSGEGAFTLALAEILGPDAILYSIDQDPSRLNTQKEQFQRYFSANKVIYMQQNFKNDLDLPLLDGIVMANSLHYIKDQKEFLIMVKKYLKPNGTLILVEYNASQGNAWVPYPLTVEMTEQLLLEAGFREPSLLGKVASHFLNEIYSLSALKSHN